MSKAFLITRHEFLVTLRRTSFIVFSLAVPALTLLGLVVLFVYQAASGEQEVKETTAGVVDFTEGPDGQPLFTAFREQDDWTFELVDDIETGTQRLLDGDLDRLYVIPENYLDTGIVREIQRQASGFGSLSEGGSSNTSPLGKFLLNNLFVGAVGPDLAQRVLTPFSVAVIEVDESGNVVDEPIDGGKLLIFMAVGILLVVSILTTSSYLLQGLNEEKENRIMEILLSSAKPEHLMIGKLLGLGSAGLVQVLIWVSSGIVAIVVLSTTDNMPGNLQFSATIPGLLIAALYFVLGYFLFGTLMAALGAVTTSQREAGQVTFIVTLPAVAPMWFISQIIENPESALSRTLSFIPFSAPAASLVRLGVNGMGLIDLAISLLLLGASVAGAMWLTARLFRAYLLMYGQRPGLKQIVGTLRNR